MSKYEFAEVLNELMLKSHATNSMLAEALDLSHENIVRDWRDGSSNKVTPTQIDEILEFFKKQGCLSIEDQNALDKYKKQDSGATVINVREQVEAKVKLDAIEDQLKAARMKVGPEEQEQIQSWIDKIEEINKRVFVGWNPRDSEMRAVPLSTLDHLAHVEIQQNILFTAIGISAGAALGILTQILADQSSSTGSWIVFIVLVFISIFLGFLLYGNEKHKKSITDSYVDQAKSYQER